MAGLAGDSLNIILANQTLLMTHICALPTIEPSWVFQEIHTTEDAFMGVRPRYSHNGERIWWVSLKGFSPCQGTGVVSKAKVTMDVYKPVLSVSI